MADIFKMASALNGAREFIEIDRNPYGPCTGGAAIRCGFQARRLLEPHRDLLGQKLGHTEEREVLAEARRLDARPDRFARSVTLMLRRGRRLRRTARSSGDDHRFHRATPHRAVPTRSRRGSRSIVSNLCHARFRTSGALSGAWFATRVTRFRRPERVRRSRRAARKWDHRWHGRRPLASRGTGVRTRHRRVGPERDPIGRWPMVLRGPGR